MKKRVFSILLSAAVLCLCSCDDHQALDTNIYPGYVLLDDHRVMSIDMYESQKECKPVGVVFSSGNSSHPTLAVLLDELQCVQFADTLGYDQGTSGDLTQFDGFSNTVSLQNSYDKKTGHGSPLGSSVFRFHEFGQSDYIPSIAEMRTLIAALPTVNPIISRLGGKTISVESTNGNCWYWTSTEVSSNKGNQAWLISAVNGSYQETPKDEFHSARAIVSLYY